jgi:hypothetical protein
VRATLPRGRSPEARSPGGAADRGKQATRRSRTGDLLITKIDQGETEKSQDELSARKAEDQD